MQREMTPRERAILDRMLDQAFPGRDELRLQLATALVTSVHPELDECFDIIVANHIPADLNRCFQPVRLHAEDPTGAWDYLLFVDLNGIAAGVEAIRSGYDCPPPDLAAMTLHVDIQTVER